ncbi:MAG TPA: DUF2141 domain-containing protein [Salinimicrobium sp.]|nr:DUF2141 domain-containing protein [Salinimicrobium sp.]
MKTIFAGFALMIATLCSAQEKNTIEVEMYNFDNSDGMVMVGLYNNESTFLDESFKKIRTKVKDEKATVTFTDIPNGTYAIALYHDENNNRELDMFLGIPTEDYGVSNNAKPALSKPDWKDVKFEVRNGKTVTQRIKL